MKNHALWHFLFYNKGNKKPPSASLANKPLGGAQMHNHCINKLLNLKGIIVKKMGKAFLYTNYSIVTFLSAFTNAQSLISFPIPGRSGHV